MNWRVIIAVVVVIMLGEVVIYYASDYYLPYYIISSLALSFFAVYFSVPKPFRKISLRSKTFHQRVMFHFFFLITLGVLFYVI